MTSAAHRITPDTPTQRPPYPKDWTDVAAEADVPVGRAVLAEAAGLPVLLVRRSGTILALADRCTHRGGPLHEGGLGESCITCPWHGSSFELDGGRVRRGPANRAQPMLAARAANGRIQVRRVDKPHGLRRNSHGR